VSDSPEKRLERLRPSANRPEAHVSLLEQEVRRQRRQAQPTVLQLVSSGKHARTRCDKGDL
jgi:hypothetical protein